MMKVVSFFSEDHSLRNVIAPIDKRLFIRPNPSI